MIKKDPTLNPAKSQVSQGMVLQSYCNSVLVQQAVNFGDFDNLKKYQKEINDGLTAAKGHANNYLNNIQPSIVTNISNIHNYYQTFNAVPIALPPGSSIDAWLNALRALKTETTNYATLSHNVVNSLSTLNSQLGDDAASFSSTVSNLNAAVNGDNGVLDQINSDLSTVDSQIAGAIAGTALSGLAIVGGVFMIAVGAIADFVTAGTTTPLIVGGVAVLAIGIGGEVASAITLKNLYAEKSDMLQRRSTLTAEVNLALGVSSAYNKLKGEAQNAMTAASQMKNAWGSLGSDLDNMATDLQNGITNADDLRTLWLAAANNSVPTIMTDIQTIKAQMAGVDLIKNTNGEKLGKFIVTEAENRVAA
ncbi:HBL/NHE enterotoxin family protein [Winogradskyella sp. HB-48]|uniref:HBL/NHE enterotoxin family protein n=1 Tax=Winogradskyella sp. HB-48 TaxID=3416808 RepID=UPI003CEA8800